MFFKCEVCCTLIQDKISYLLNEKVESLKKCFNNTIETGITKLRDDFGKAVKNVKQKMCTLIESSVSSRSKE